MTRKGNDSKNAYERCSDNNKGPIHEERRLQIEELDEWQTHRLRTHDEPKPHHDELKGSPNQLKVGDKVLLDAADPRIATSEPNEKNSSYGTTSSSRGKKTAVPASKKRKGVVSFSGPTTEIRHPFLQVPLGPQKELYKILRARPLGVGRCIDWVALEQIQLADAVRALLTTNSWGLFFEIVELTYLVFTLELCLTFHLQTIMTNFDDPRTRDLVPASATYDPSRSKAFALPPSLRRSSTGEVISIGPYVTRLAWHFGLLNTLAQSSSLTLIGQMSPQGISSMLSMRMIEKRCGTYPSQYRLVQSTEEEDPEDITDDVPPHHEDPPSQPPPPSRPIHAAASYANISECLALFDQHCFQRFDNIDATLQ
ncbi:hypothetical protein GOBAR_AA32740 [Gossypium barbadense]|uniref:Uncharacterized protein n=1 Tax=Gossypium barbadense TaxID=3634 RepID=A0A2P5WA27_GOSBA|nr:hypothetical protein GOBAR_AA32740 [Gossypium barbadense]